MSDREGPTGAHQFSFVTAGLWVVNFRPLQTDHHQALFSHISGGTLVKSDTCIQGDAGCTFSQFVCNIRAA